MPAKAGAPAAPAPLAAAPHPSAQGPFSIHTSAISDGGIVAKWQSASHAIAADVQTIRNCRADRAACDSPEALRLIAIAEQARARDGLARLGEVNRAINLAVRQTSDHAQYGAMDYWASPLVTLGVAAGDCEDFAILKMAVLREAGVAASDMRLVIVRDLQFNDDHAVLAVRFDGRWRILDNRKLLMVEDIDMQRTLPLFTLDETGVHRFGEPDTTIAEAPNDAVKPASSAEVAMDVAATFDDRFIF